MCRSLPRPELTAVNSSGGGKRPPAPGAIETSSLKRLTESAGTIHHDAVVSIVDSALRHADAPFGLSGAVLCIRSRCYRFRRSVSVSRDPSIIPSASYILSWSSVAWMPLSRPTSRSTAASSLPGAEAAGLVFRPVHDPDIMSRVESFNEFSIETVVFGAHPATLGARFRGSLMGTGDADFVRFQSISAAVGGGLPSMLDPLRVVDSMFRGLSHTGDGQGSTLFRSSSGFLVEFLNPTADRPTTTAGRPRCGPWAALWPNRCGSWMS